MIDLNSSLDDGNNIDLTFDYPYNEAIRLPYFSDCNQVKVQIKGYDFNRLAKLFLPSPDLASSTVSDYENVRYYKCNPPAADRTYELPSNVMEVQAKVTPFFPLLSQPKNGFNETPENLAYRKLQQKRWLKLLSCLDDLWWALMIESHYINGRFGEVSELIRHFFHALLKRERIENIMEILSKEWYESEDIDYWMGQIAILHKVKLDREREIVESGHVMSIQRLRGAA